MREHELRSAIQELEREAAAEPFTVEQKGRWNELNKQLDEYAVRRERLRELATPARTEGENSRSYIADERLPQEVRTAHDEGLRAIATHQGALSTRAADQLDRLVREGDEQGLGSR